MQKLKEGDQVFAYMKGRGYVGYGTVVREAQAIKEYCLLEDDRPLLDHPLKATDPDSNLDDPALSEWVVGVRWLKAFPREEARYFKGAFANQNVVCKLRHPPTVEFLEREFEVGE